MPENRPERFIAAVASIGSVTAVLSLVTLSISGSGRSGTVLVIGEIAGESVSGVASEAFLLLLMAAALGSLGGYLLTIKAGEVFSVLAERVDQKRLSRWVLALTIVLVIVLTGPFGLMMLFVSTLVGFLPGAFGTDRTILSGCLLLPVILMQFRSEPGRSLGHELRVVHHETLVGPGADLPRSIPDDGLEDQPPSVDLD
jgi:putative membrane protein